MKHVLLFGLMLASFFSYSQYPASGVKQRLGWQTTGDGLVYRGAISDTSTLDPSGINNAWMLLDTVSGNLYAYRIKAWRLVSGGGGGGLSMPFDSVTFNINEGDASEQELKYSAEKGYLQYGGLDSVQIPLLPGIWYVRNDTSVTIPKGTVVRASGTLGASGRIKVKHMIANGSIPAMYVLGIAMQDIAVGADGYVMAQGKIRKVNTTAYSEGAILYADVDTLGGLTQTEPSNGYLKLPIAFVVHSASNGTLAVRIDAGSSLHDLHDVDTAGRVNGSVLRYDSALKYWKASTTAGIVAGDTAAMLTNYINVADTAAMLSSYISNADTSVFARDFQISGTSGQVTYFNGSNTVTGDANLTWSAANRTLGINTTTTSGANIIIKNTQEPVRSTFLSTQTFGADTTNWTRGAGWTFNGTQAVATAATGALTYTTLPDTIISGRAYEVTYTLESYSAGTVTVAVGNVSLALPAYNVTGNAVLLRPTSATGGFRFTTSTFTGRLDNIAVVEVRNPALVLLAGQDDGSASLYNPLRMPNSSTLAFNGGGSNSTGGQNNFVGSSAGSVNTTGSFNNFFGYSAGVSNTIGSYNNFFGNSAGESNTIGGFNNFFGSNAGLLNTIGTDNNFFGNSAGRNNTSGSYNNFFGVNAGTANTTGGSNVFFGSNSGLSNTTGNFNVFMGINSGYANIVGSRNFFFGGSAGRSNTSGSDNFFFGPNAGYNLTAADTLTGSNNIAIGSESVRNIASSAAGNLVLGNSVNLPTGNGSNQVVIKNLIFGTGASGTGTTIQTTAKAGINVNNPQSTLDVEGNMAIGATYSGTTAAPTNGLIVQGNTGIGTSSPQRRLHITGTVRVDTLTRDVPTRIVGADADGDLAAFKLGTGLSIASDTLKTSAILPADTSVFARDWQIAGTTNYLQKSTGTGTIGNSVVYETSGGNVGINSTTATNNKFQIGSVGSSGYTGNDLAIGNGTQAMAIAVESDKTSLATNTYFLVQPFSANTSDSSLTVNGSFRVANRSRFGGRLYIGAHQTYLDTPTVALLANGNATRSSYTSWIYSNSGSGQDATVLRVGGSNNWNTDKEESIDLGFNRISSYYQGSNKWGLKFYTYPNSSFTSGNVLTFNGDGRVGIGTTSPSRTLHISATDALKLPAGTTAERPSVGITGDLRMNTSPTVDSLEYYNGISWVTVQDKLQNPVTGTGTANRLAKFTGTSFLGDSPIVLTGDTLITFGTAAPGLVTINTKDFPNTPGQMPYTKFKLNTGYGINGISMGDPSGPLYGTQTALQFTTYDGTFSGGFDYWSTRLTGDGFGNFHISNSPANSDGDTVMTNRLSITAAGKVGINKSAPDSTLDVVGSSYITGNMLLNGRLGVGAQNQRHKAYFYGTGNGYAIPDTGVYILNNSSSSSPNVGLAVRQLSPGWESSNTGISGYASGWYNDIIGVLGKARIGDLNSIATTAIGIRGEVDTATYTSNPGSFQSTTIAGYFKNNMRRGGNHYGVFIQTDSAGDYGIYQTGFGVNYLAGKLGIGTTSPARTLHVEGEARISDLTTDTPTRIVGADADGDLGEITLGTGLSISSGTLNASGITSVYIPINLFSPGDTVTNTTNSKNFFLVHSGLNGYCIDSYTVKAIAGTGTADIQVDKNDTGGNLQAISGTTVYTKDTNIALVTGDYIRGQVFNLSGTLIGLGLTLEIKATCN